MDEHNKSSTDFDDAEILSKFRNLLSKYQNQGKLIGFATPISASASMATSQLDGILQGTEVDEIPTLTEIVVLHPSVIQPQPKRSTPIQQILDAALKDSHIEMDALDRKALAHALRIRLIGQADST